MRDGIGCLKTKKIGQEIRQYARAISFNTFSVSMSTKKLAGGLTSEFESIFTERILTTENTKVLGGRGEKGARRNYEF